MRKALFSTMLIFLLIMTGCGTGTDDIKTEKDKMAEELDPTRNKDETVDPEWDSRLGYVNYTKDQFDHESERGHVITMDRNKLADTIARIILRNDAFDEIATMVTDQEVLIAYSKNDTLSDEKAANFARKSAKSITPRFFDVYVSDNPALIPDIKSLHNETTKQRGHKNTLDQILSEMEKDPQDKDD